jgi:Spy/CpxP family protein refolding chaperone
MNTPTKRYRPSLTFAIGVMLASLPAAFAVDSEATPSPETRRERMEKAGDRLADELGLSDDQKTKWKAIGEQEKAEIDTLRKDTSVAKEDRRAKAGEIHQKYKAQRDALLTPEQKTKADKMRERMGKWQERREGRKDKNGDKPAEQK